MRHLIDFGDLTRAEWESLYQRCSDIMDHPADFMDACRGRVMASLFYEPSTRTNFSFQTAMLRVGGTVLGTGRAACLRRRSVLMSEDVLLGNITPTAAVAAQFDGRPAILPRLFHSA